MTGSPTLPVYALRMKSTWKLAAAAAARVGVGGATATLQEGGSKMSEVRLMTVDPGHFHAALVQKEMYPGVSKRVDVYGPLGWDLFEHLNRITSFNRRADRPTAWELEVHTSPDYFERMLREHPGNVVILSGRNRGKIDRIAASVKGGLHVLADKPWILEFTDFQKLESVLADADAKQLIAYDIMTERFELTSMIQRDLVNDRATFGTIVPGTQAEPAVYMESVHHLMKTVAGAPNIRPTWFFDTTEQGEGANDIGTHLVDLVQWTVFLDQPINYKSDVRVLAAQRWPTWIPEADFKRVTNTPKFPDSLAKSVKDGRLEYYSNTLVSYEVKGIHTKLNVIWDWEAPAGSGDTHFAFYRGTKSRVEVRQTKADKYIPELYVIPATADVKGEVLAATQKKIAALQQHYPGVTVEDRGAEIKINIPATYRVGHEAHFAQVTVNFLRSAVTPKNLRPLQCRALLAKYFVTTKGAELGRQGPPQPAPRIAPK